ncbi:hypothetical protein LTR28_007481 [Elasticomyces elasticus]|nr:hypothetical protein LTR28_007481 [Elasticomyces elasticus]
MPARLYITSDTRGFDPMTLEAWRAEGFDVTYLPYDGDVEAYGRVLRRLADEMERGEGYAIVSYGDAAALCLAAAHTDPPPHLRALIAYYPSSIPRPKPLYPPQLTVLTHLASSQEAFAPAFPSHTYADARPGFAERHSDAYDGIAAGLAWSRTLGAVRRALGIEVELEKIWEEHVALEFATKDAAATMKTMVDRPYVNHIPTMTGGIGQEDLFRFYRDYFIPSNPPSFAMKLVSRTIGVNRVVDEMIVSFRHTEQVPWMLPDVPPTNKQVLVALVAIVCIRGGKLYHEHLYWDQASVLVQVGLLDPKLVPDSMKQQGLKRLPVVGAEGALKVMDESSQPSNELLSSWKQANGSDEASRSDGA